MANTVLLKRSNTANAVPLAGNLTAGELALNYTDGNLFYKNNAGNVVLIASNQTLSVTGNITGGNLLLSGLISATGNITGGNITTSGAGGNITGANVITATTFSATGNITGNYFIGNGSLLTGISAGSGNAISNGTSNVIIPTANGSIYLSDDGVPNAAVFSNGSFTMAGSFATPKTTTANSTVTSNVNAMLLGPVSIGAGTTITVPSSSTLSIYTEPTAYSNTNVATYLASGTDTSNIITTANITGGNINSVALSLSGNIISPIRGSSTIVAGSTISAAGNITGANINTAGLITATGNITGVANIAGGNITTAGVVSALGNIQTANSIVYANTTSVAKSYQFYNSATSSIDMVFL